MANCQLVRNGDVVDMGALSVGQLFTFVDGPLADGIFRKVISKAPDGLMIEKYIAQPAKTRMQTDMELLAKQAIERIARARRGAQEAPDESKFISDYEVEGRLPTQVWA